MKKTLLVTAVAACAAFSTGAKADMPNLGLCSKAKDSMLSSCDAEHTGLTATVQKYQCKAGAYMVFGLCKTITGGLGATAGTSAHEEVVNACKTAKDSEACQTKLASLINKYSTTVIKDMVDKESDFNTDLSNDFKKAVTEAQSAK